MASEDQQYRLDEATSARLRKLGAMPVDTSRLDRLIEQQIPRARVSRGWVLRPLRAVAAGIAMIGMIGVLMFSLSGGPALASADAMARMHNEVISGQLHVTKVSSIADASKALAMDLPEVPIEHVMMCCMHSVENKRVACVVLQSDGGIPVTMAVAKAADMQMPAGRSVTRDGQRYLVQQSGKLNMVMTERAGQWICLIGELEQDRLINIADAIQF